MRVLLRPPPRYVGKSVSTYCTNTRHTQSGASCVRLPSRVAVDRSAKVRVVGATSVLTHGGDRVVADAAATKVVLLEVAANENRA